MKTHEYNLRIITLVREFRQLKGVKQSTMAHAIGVDRSTYSRIEKGICAYTPGQLRKFTEILDLNFFSILHSAENG